MFKPFSAAKEEGPGLPITRIPVQLDIAEPTHTRRQKSYPINKPFRLKSPLGAFVAIFALCVLAQTYRWCRRTPTARISTGTYELEGEAPRLGIPHAISHSWAMYSPWHAAGKVQPLAQNCKVVQANILQRHGARFPTEHSGQRIQGTLGKLKSAKKLKGPLEFVKDYEYSLGNNALVPFGASQSFESGVAHYQRYASLVSPGQVPFVRASGSERVIDSAQNWTAGFSSASDNKTSPVLNLIIPETDGFNNSIHTGYCEAEESDKAAKRWRSVYAHRIAKRLKKHIKGAHLTNDDVSNLISLCAFDTVAHEKPGPFCSVFDQADFEAYEYEGDLNKYYGSGYGHPFVRVQGVAYINELIARLTGSPVKDGTSTNTTLDSSPETFPLDRSFYIDFSHDNYMITVMSAMGLFQEPRHLRPKHPDPNRTWFVSKMVPFSTRIITEKIECAGEDTSFVRIMVNDAVQPLEFCGANKDGLCDLESFIQSQDYATSGGHGDWKKCLAASST